MAPEDFKRKLTAIFSADVAGYSRLMGEDEAATVRTLATYREVMTSLIEQQRGRIVDSPGDNVLAEFVSVVDAVQCAVAVQKELQARNAELPESRRMEFRIGINLGDVIDEDDRIYGDGVNIAARLEALADPGGICISKTAFDQIETKLPLGYEFLGEQDVKNIAKPVGAYRVLMDAETVGKVIGEIRPKTKQLRGVAIGAVAVLIIVAAALAIWNFYFRPAFEPASVEKMAYPLPEEPSIAVLPFVNMSRDPEQEYLSDGITEQIITTLSKVPKMFVIARNSTFVYKGKPVKVSRIGEELGVKYVLEGSVQRSGDRVRITAQLIDTTKGHHLWADHYDRNLSDIFALQDEIAKKVITALQVELTEGEQARLWARGTENLEAYLRFLQGYQHYRQRNPDDLILARQFFEEAIALDPEYADPFIYMGQIHLTEVRQALSKSPEKSINQAFELAQKALSLDELHPGVYNLLAWVYLDKGQYEKGIAECERAVALYPNHNQSLFFLGIALSVSDRPHEAIPFFERALRLNPLDPTPALYGLGDTYRVMGRCEEAIPKLEKALALKPKFFPALLNLVACYSSLGREKEARETTEKILKLNPNFSLERFAKTMLHRGAVKERYLAALRKAGLPETPPLPLPDKPSIAVLPFVNMSGDPKQEYFSDGITEQIITSISKIPRLFVISRTSSFKYKGKAVDVKQVGRELGVKYVLEGSVQRSEERLRITAQLIDAITGEHLWAERYDRRFKDLFALQDEITMKVMLSLSVKLTEGERLRLRSGRTSTNNLKALEKLFEAVPYIRAFNIESNVTARQLSEEVIALDPEFAAGYDMLACTHFMDVHLGSSKSPRKSLAQATKLLQKTIFLDENYALAYSHLCHVYGMQRQYEKAIAEGEKAVALNPNSDDALVWLGMAMDWVGRSEEAIALYKKAMRLCPFPPSFYYLQLGHAYRSTERYKEAITEYKKALHLTQRNVIAFSGLAICYSLLGQEEEAHAAAAEVMRISPNFSLDSLAKRLPYKNPADIELYVNALRKAGLK
jgi:adenylate cyclase